MSHHARTFITIVCVCGVHFRHVGPYGVFLVNACESKASVSLSGRFGAGLVLRDRGRPPNLRLSFANTASLSRGQGYIC